MQFKKNVHSITIVILIILLGSMILSPSTPTGQTNIPNTNIETGDTFEFILETNNSEDKIRVKDLWNRDNISQTFSYVEELKTGNSTGIGRTDQFYARNVDPNPDLDSTFIIDFWIESQPGSIYSGYRDDGRWDGYNQQFVWNNGSDTPWSFDATGQYYQDDEQISTTSNSTYAIIASEMVDQTTSIDWNPPIPMDQPPPALSLNQAGPGPNYQATLSSRFVQDWIDPVSMTINGINHNLNLVSVVSEFSLTHQEPWKFTEFSEGKEIMMNGTWYLNYNQFSNFTFDKQTGLLVEMYQDETFDFWAEANNNSFIIWDQGAFGGYNASTYVFESEYTFESQWMILDKASSHYGNSRLVSSGTNRIMEGDQIIYDIDGFGESTMDWYVKSGESHTDVRSWDASYSSIGDLIFDVYRNQNGSFEAVILMDQTVTRDWMSFEGNFNGNNWSNRTDDPQPMTYNQFEIDSFATTSNSSYEVQPFLDDTMWLDLGEGGFGFDIRRDIPLINQTSEIMYDNYTINGFDYFLEVEVITGYYEMTNSSRSSICFCDNPNSAPPEYSVALDIEVNAWGISEFVYDTWTGVLLEVYEEKEYNITIYGSDTLDIQDQYGNWYNGTNRVFDMDISGYNNFDVVISSHPRLYKASQTEFPTPPVTTTVSNTTSSVTTTTSTVSTNTTTSSTTDTNVTTSEETTTPAESSIEDTTPAPSLPLPVPFYAIGVGILFAHQIYRRKRR